MLQQPKVTQAESPQAEITALRVASTSDPKKVAGAIAGLLREREHVELRAIGAGAINQMVKSLSVARLYLKDDGIDISAVPEFSDIEINGRKRTSIVFNVTRWKPPTWSH